MRVSKTANKQRERIEIRFDTISSELFFCEIIRVLRVAEMPASITKERERERERERFSRLGFCTATRRTST